MTQNLDDEPLSDKANQPRQSPHWTIIRDTIGLPVFPISLKPKPGGGTEKKPLTKNGHKDASYNVGKFDWSNAQGFGIPMGKIGTGVGYYAFDIDSYKDGAGAAQEWLMKWGCLEGTRTHQTVSGGTHLIFMLPGSHVELPSRANIVQGLDSRGEGGWIAFGQGYKVINDKAPALLNAQTCEEIRRGYKGGGPGSTVEIGAYIPPADESVIARKYANACHAIRLLGARQRGTKTGGDLSRSARDHSVAYCLASDTFGKWSEDEIAYVLLHLYPHGACTDPRLSMALRERAAKRSAAKAVSYVTEMDKALKGIFKSAMSDEQYLAFIRDNANE